MRSTLLCCLLLSLLPVCLATLPPSAHGDARPRMNIVLIMADDLGAAELGCYGNFDHRTPHLDRLADEGMRFRTCWSTPLCTPTRVMLMTGRYAWRTGWFNLIGRPLTPREDSTLYDLADQRTFAHLLDAAGYATAMAGKWQLPGRVPDLVHECGFDEYRMWAYVHNLPRGTKHEGGWQSEKRRVTSRFWNPCLLENGAYRPTGRDEYGPDLYTDFLIDFIRRHRSEPFLAYYPMCLTHKPWVETPDAEDPKARKPEGLKSNVETMDRVVGRIVAALDELGLSDRTVVLFTGDNGTQGAGKAKVTEMGVRVPLIVRCPGLVPAGTVGDALVSLADVFPTVLDLAGLDLPPDLDIDGVSLLPTLRGEAGVLHRPWVYSYLEEKEMIRDERWLLEGDGRLWDCTLSREGKGYETPQAEDPEALAAKTRLEAILEEIPGPDAVRSELRTTRRR